ncbi:MULTISPECIES: HNH endonuclease signature motif containing protein [Pseudomonas]|uniref:HNH endonuclease signature motif containing protein n=1 Tax=Pseudomonas TaxID=286 RepID=UPI0013CED085|nr:MULTISPECIES: HNH endonuclease signature motif containing protein [Pseudomonas]MCE0874158.1 HNH endonuclease [Pseudomonas monteilii]MCE0926779.1 HNH endonuclease [Pseudomonas monteilii]MCE0932343.1 HNH endonuclease [Pseudomonas monteilii]MCE0973601.1 HNH endonuclease [Pseudomonas putida]MCE0978370.1 HNH endonuclease [Pseudomonas monteilii]
MIAIDRLREEFTYDADSGVIRSLSVRAMGRIEGAKSPNGYLKLRLDGVNLYAHRVAWALTHGVWPAHDIDHINGERDDNRLSNLRALRRHENLQNMRKRRPGASGVRGITWDKQTQTWRAQLSAQGKRINIGRFKDKEMAEVAYLEAKRRHHPFSAEASQ